MDGWCDCSYIPWDVQGLDQIYLFFYYTMEKLLKLLNEYRLKNGRSGYTKYISEAGYFTNKSYFYEHYSWVISKKCWFIQWLMDQNKIEFDRARDRSDFPLLYAGWWELYSDAEVIIATLSVEDDPIEFLVSILK